MVALSLGATTVSRTEQKHRAERHHGFCTSPSEGRPCQFLHHLRDRIHLTDWTVTLRSSPLLISQRIVWTSVPPLQPTLALPPLKESCLQNISESAVVRVCSDPHTSLRLCEILVPFLPLNVPQLCGLRLLTS